MALRSQRPSLRGARTTLREAPVKDDIKKLLAASGAYYFMPVQSGYGIDTVDFLGFRWPDGRGFAIEAKRPGEEPTARQRKRLRTIYETGAAVFVIDGDVEDLAMLKTWLSEPAWGKDSAAERLIRKWDIWRKEDALDK